MHRSLLPALLCVCSCADEPSASPDAGVPVAESGIYRLSVTGESHSPEGCRSTSPANEDWTWDVAGGAHSIAVVERYRGEGGQTFTLEYDCSGGPEALICTGLSEFDYKAIGRDAHAVVAVTYELTWTDAETFTGVATVDVSCEGGACEGVTADWRVLSFPCETRADIAGVWQDL